MAVLKLDIVLDDNGAAQRLQQIESGLRGIEASAKTSGDALAKQVSTTSGLDGLKDRIRDVDQKLKDHAASAEAFAAQWDNIGRNLQTSGRHMSSLGSALSIGLTAPIVALGGFAIKAAMDFETAFSGVSKTVDGVADKSGKLTAFGRELEQGFRNLAKTIPITVNELAAIGETAGAMGIPKEKLLDFTAVVAKLGATTNLTSQQAATALGHIQNAYGAAGVDTDRFAAALVDLGNKGASTEAEIVRFAERMAATGAQMGISQAQLLGWANAMASIGIKAELGSTAWMRTLNAMSVAVDQHTPKLEAFARVAGMAGPAFASLFKQDASEAMMRFIEGLNRIKESGGNVTGVLEDLKLKSVGFNITLKGLANAHDMVRESLNTGMKAWRDNAALEEEFAKRAATTASMLKVLWNRVYDVGIELGKTLIPHMMRLQPVFEGAMSVITGVVGLFGRMPVPLQASALAIVGLGAALGPVLYIAGNLTTVGGQVISMLSGWLGAQTAANVALAGTAPVAASAATGLGRLYAVAAAHPFVAIAAAVAALTYSLYELKGAWDNAVAAKQQGGWKAVVGELGRNVNNDDWSLFKSWRVDQQPGYKAPGGKPASNPVDEFIAQQEAAQKFMKDAAAKRPDLFPDMETLSGGGGRKTHGKTSAEREADAWQKFNDDITGRSAIKSAQEWMKHLQQVGGLTQITEKATRDLRDTLGDAIEAYARLGQVAPDAMRDTWISTLMPGVQPLTKLPGEQMGMPQIPLPPIPSVGFSSGIQGSTLPGQQFGIPTPPQGPSFFQRAFGTSEQFGSQLAATIMGAVQNGSSIWQNAGSFIGSHLGQGLANAISGGLGGWLGGALNALLPGIGSLLGPILGKVGGFFKNLFGGNDTKALINETFGSYDALRQQLNALGDAGERMWIKLTQQTGKNDLVSAKAQILEIQKALGQLDQQSVTVDVHWNADALPDVGDLSASYQPYEAPQDVPPMARGGIVRARPGGTLVRVGEAGSDEMITPLGTGGANGGTAIIQIDGRTMAEIVVPHVPGVVKRYRVGTL